MGTYKPICNINVKFACDLLALMNVIIGSLLSVSVYYVAVRTIVLSRHGSSLARPVIIHDIIQGLIYVPSTPCCGIFWGLAGWKLRLRPLRFFNVHLIYVVL